MSDQPALLPPDPPANEAALPPPRPRGRTNPIPWLFALGFLILAGANYYLWQYPNIPTDTVASAADMHAVQQRLDAVDARQGRMEQGLNRLEQDLGRLQQDLGQLRQEPKPASPADVAKLSTRMDALEGRVSDQTQLASRLDVISGRVESLSGRDQSGIDAVKQQLDNDAGRLSALEKTSGNLQTVSAEVTRIARLQAASLALANGRPLGDIPGAPPALTRFAQVAPPTLAQLRLAFPQVEHAVTAASPPSSASGPFLDRVWERAQDLVTVRQGDAVVVGNPASIALTHAGTALEAGDLAAAVNALSALGSNTPPAATDWLAQAKALLAARAALADMGAHS